MEPLEETPTINMSQYFGAIPSDAYLDLKFDLAIGRTSEEISVMNSKHYITYVNYNEHKFEKFIFPGITHTTEQRQETEPFSLTAYRPENTDETYEQIIEQPHSKFLFSKQPFC